MVSLAGSAAALPAPPLDPPPIDPRSVYGVDEAGEKPAEEEGPGEAVVEETGPEADRSADAGDGEVSGAPGDEEGAEAEAEAESAELPPLLREQRPQDEETLLPKLDIYLPEGELELRVNRLVKKAYVEGQVNYNFADGDITAFLRYRYYGFNRTYQLSVFDEVEFEGLEEFSGELERTRGVLFLTSFPHSYNQRSSALVEVDQLTTNKEEFFFTNQTTNTFIRLGHQIGTPDDRRSNAIVGEDRARIDELFTAFRQIGPRDAGVTGAVEYGFDFTGADYDYVRLEYEALKRFELPGDSFLITRSTGGTFFGQEDVERPNFPDATPLDLLSIPRQRLFRLDGRRNLKGLDGNLLEERGTDKLLFTAEAAYPWFTHQKHRALGVDWQHWYWVAYSGIGTIGLDHDVISEFDSYKYDFGLGFESSFRLKDYELYLSVLVVQAFNTEESSSPKFRLSVKSYH